MGNIIFRADASIEMGTGHVMRCLTLAHALKSSGHRCHFICRDHSGHLASAITHNGFQMTLLEGGDEPQTYEGLLPHATWLACSQTHDALQTLNVLHSLGTHTIDWLIVDHYALDAAWERQLKDQVIRIMVIDDLFDRQHECDILLNQNLGSTAKDYQHLVPKDCEILAGIDFAMLRPEFTNYRASSLENKSGAEVRQILITLGGVDPDNYTGRILEKLKACKFNSVTKIIVILGETAVHKDRVKMLALSLPFQVEVGIGVDNMAEIMANSDLAIGAAGSTSWERCCLGLPTLLLVIAENQIKLAEQLQENGAVVLADLGTSPDSFCSSIERLINDADFYGSTSRAASKLCDGRGVERVVSHLHNSTNARY